MNTRPLPPPITPVMYVERPSRGAAVASLVLGIVGVCIGLIPILGYFAIPMGVIGFILGLAGVHKAKRNGGGKAMGRAGWMLSLVAIAFSIIGMVAFTHAVDELDRCLNGNDAACAEIGD